MDPATEREPKRLQRSRRGVFLGVCRGVADYFNLDVALVRIAFFLALVFTGFFPWGAVYLVMAIFMPKEPKRKKAKGHVHVHRDDGPMRDHVTWDSRDDEDLLEKAARFRVQALHRVRGAYAKVEEKLQRM